MKMFSGTITCPFILKFSGPCAFEGISSHGPISLVRGGAILLFRVKNSQQIWKPMLCIESNLSMGKVFSFVVVSVSMSNNQYCTRQVLPLFVWEMPDQIPGTERPRSLWVVCGYSLYLWQRILYTCGCLKNSHSTPKSLNCVHNNHRPLAPGWACDGQYLTPVGDSDVVVQAS